LIAKCAVLADRFVGNLDEAGRQVGIQRIKAGRSAHQYFGDDVTRRLSVKWNFARQHLVENDSQAEEITTPVHRLSARLLGRHVLR